MEARLDNVRTHAAVSKTPVAQEEVASTEGQPEVSAPSTLMVQAAQPAASNSSDMDAAASATNAAWSDGQFFDVSIPRYMPASLRGTHEVLVHQNIIADVEGLSRIENDAQLNAMVQSGDLVALPASAGLLIDPRLPSNRRYCRPWVAKFLRDLSSAHERVFGHPLLLTSAVRTVDFQRHLARYNSNAAPTSGDTASPHLTGEAVDLGKKGMSLHEIAWMRAVLGHLQESGRLDVEEEFHQACFHISVYKTYTTHSPLPARLVASDEAAPADEARTEDTAAAATIGGLAQPVSEPVRRRAEVHHAHRYATHRVRRAVTHRRRRRHHTSMSLLAARLR